MLIHTLILNAMDQCQWIFLGTTGQNLVFPSCLHGLVFWFFKLGCIFIYKSKMMDYLREVIEYEPVLSVTQRSVLLCPFSVLHQRFIVKFDRLNWCNANYWRLSKLQTAACFNWQVTAALGAHGVKLQQIHEKKTCFIYLKKREK
jgi:hypothetical protein